MFSASCIVSSGTRIHQGYQRSSESDCIQLLFRARKLRIKNYSIRGSFGGAVGPAVLTFLLAIAACAGTPRVQISGPSGSSKAVVAVEIADTPAARELGLMYRQHLESNAGMLFVFRQPQHLTFWMKNTEIPLDMIFADSNGRIAGIVVNAEPFSEQQLSVDGDSQYVLEVNGGFTQQHGIKAGDLLQFLGIKPNASE